jgi:hypothetical protein
VTRLDGEFGFDPDAPNDTTASLYRMARAGGATVLHLGRGAESVTHALSALDAIKVTWVVADSGVLDSTTHGPELCVADPDAPAWYIALDGRTYDIVIVADLLERVRDPARLLRDLREQRLLAEEGRLLVSFASVAHPAVMNELLSGDFVRLHWYTAASMNRLLSATGYLVVETHHMPHTTFVQSAEMNADDESQTYEYVLQAQPSTAGPQLALIRRQLDDAMLQLAETEALRGQISSLLEEERTAFHDEIGRGADELERLQAELAQVSDDRSTLHAETTRLHDQLARVKDELSMARKAQATAERRLAAVQRSRSYRWSRGLAKAANVFVAPLRSGWRPKDAE